MAISPHHVKIKGRFDRLFGGFGGCLSILNWEPTPSSKTDRADYGLRLTGCQEIGSDHVMFIFERAAVMFGRL